VVSKNGSALDRVIDLDSSARLEIVMSAPVTFVTGKGGVGKTTIASLLSREAHSHGERVLFISLNRDTLSDQVIGITDKDIENDVFRSRNFGFDVSIVTPSSSLANYLSAKHMGSLTKKLNKIGLLDMVANTVPGMRELLVVGDIRSKAESKKWDRIIVDAPSTGHARSLFNIHESTNAVANTGVIKHQSDAAKEFLRDSDRVQVVVATLDHAMPLSEAKEFIFELEEDLEMHIAGVIINKSNAANTRKSHAIDKHLDQVFVPIYSYPNQNIKQKKRSLFERFKTNRKLSSDLNSTYNFDKNIETCIALGTGGVGKTTTAAAIALSLASKNKKVALLTIDPARRLGIALGLPDSTSSESYLDPITFSQTTNKQALLHVFQLDTNKEFLSLLEKTLDEPTFEDAKDNTFVSAVSRMGIVNEFMAIEAMHRLVNSNEYEIVIVDTPPSHHVFDLLEAPKAIERMTNSKVFKTIVGAGTMASVTTNMALGTILRPLKGLVGAQLVTDAIDFMRTLKDVEEVFTQHCADVVSYLENNTTSYVAICHPSSTSLDQAGTLVRGMHERNYFNCSVIVNGVDTDDEDEIQELEQFASRMKRFDAPTTIIEEIELDNPFDIVKVIAKKVDLKL